MLGDGPGGMLLTFKECFVEYVENHTRRMELHSFSTQCLLRYSNDIVLTQKSAELFS